jgi:hypothetical protein
MNGTVLKEGPDGCQADTSFNFLVMLMNCGGSLPGMLHTTSQLLLLPNEGFTKGSLAVS